MPIELIDPPGLPAVDLYRQVAVAIGTRTVHVAGQVSVDATGALVGADDLSAQIEQCYRNVATALAAAGATLDDVVKLTAYFVDWTPELMTPLAEGMERARVALGTASRPPFTGIGVAALAAPGFLVEIEAVAVT